MRNLTQPCEHGCGVRQEDEALVVVDRHSRHSLKAAVAFLLPALCDSLATTLLNLGLYYTCEHAILGLPLHA